LPGNTTFFGIIQFFFVETDGGENSLFVFRRDGHTGRACGRHRQSHSNRTVGIRLAHPEGVLVSRFPQQPAKFIRADVGRFADKTVGDTGNDLTGVYQGRTGFRTEIIIVRVLQRRFDVERDHVVRHARVGRRKRDIVFFQRT